MPKPKTGRLQYEASARTAGKNIAKWTYRSALPGQPRIEVLVNLCNPRDGDYHFTAEIVGMKGLLSHKVLDELRKQVDEKLTGLCDDASNLVWEDWLRVKVVGSNRGYSTSGKSSEHMSLSVSYEVLPRAVLPDGKAVTMYETNNVLVPFPTGKRSAIDMNRETMILDDATDDGCEVSYIKATPEAYASLNAIQAKLNDLRNALSSLLSQDSIEKELPKMQAWLQLPGTTK